MSSDSSSGEGEAISHQPSPGSYPGEGDTPSTSAQTRATVTRSTSNSLSANILGSETPTPSSPSASSSSSSSNRRVRRSSSSSPSATPAKRYKTPEQAQQLSQQPSRLIRSPRQNNLQETRTASPFGCSSLSPSSPNSLTGLPSTSRSTTATLTSLPTAVSAVSGEESEDKQQTMPSLFSSSDDSGNNVTGTTPSSNGSSYARSNGLTNGSASAGDTYPVDASSGINGAATTNGTSNGQRFFSKSVHDYEIIRLISQQLRDYGFHQTVDTLMQESGCKSDHPVASRFQQHILNGEWSEAENDLNEMKSLISDSSAIVEMKFLILEQKYLEQLDCDKTSEALDTLRSSLTPLNHRRERIHELTTLLMCHSKEEMHSLASWQGKGIESRRALMEKLQTFIPPEIMLPPHRLNTLLAQAVEMQKAKCRLHNDLIDSKFDGISLLTDHECTSAQFPMETLQVLPNHCEEVCYCAFSNDGTKLATGSKDNTVIIWDVDSKTLEVKYRCTFDGHNAGCYFLAWSPDDTYLLVCGHDDSSEVWVWNVQTGDLRVKANQTPEDSLTACAWHKDGKKFVTGGTKGQFYLFVSFILLLPLLLLLSYLTHHLSLFLRIWTVTWSPMLGKEFAFNVWPGRRMVKQFSRLTLIIEFADTTLIQKIDQIKMSSERKMRSCPLHWTRVADTL